MTIPISKYSIGGEIKRLSISDNDNGDNFKFAINGNNYYAELVDIHDSNASDIRLKLSSGVKSWKLHSYDVLPGGPGPSTFIAGDKYAGFLGEVPASELFTAEEIASACSVSQGTAQNSNEVWLKFMIDQKTIFVAKKPMRHSVSYAHLQARNIAMSTGGRIVEKNGYTFRSRMFAGKGTNSSPTVISDAHGSEWNRLMLPIHEKIIDGSWAVPDAVEEGLPTWTHILGTGVNNMYSDADLSTTVRTWCAEFYIVDPDVYNETRVARGSTDASRFSAVDRRTETTTNTWRPVLELVE